MESSVFVCSGEVMPKEFGFTVLRYLVLSCELETWSDAARGNEVRVSIDVYTVRCVPLMRDSCGEVSFASAVEAGSSRSRWWPRTGCWPADWMLMALITMIIPTIMLGGTAGGFCRYRCLLHPPLARALISWLDVKRSRSHSRW